MIDLYQVYIIKNQWSMCLIENEFSNKERDIIQQFKVKVQIFWEGHGNLKKMLA